MFAKVDTGAEQQLAGELGVRAIPTLMAFRDGVLVFSRAGALPGSAIDSLVAQVEALDIDAIRRGLNLAFYDASKVTAAPIT